MAYIKKKLQISSSMSMDDITNIPNVPPSPVPIKQHSIKELRKINPKPIPEVFKWCSCDIYRSYNNRDLGKCYSDCSLKKYIDEHPYMFYIPNIPKYVKMHPDYNE